MYLMRLVLDSLSPTGGEAEVDLVSPSFGEGVVQLDLLHANRVCCAV